MKKILFSILFLACLAICFPTTVFGYTMEMTVTISSLIVPERAEMIVASDRPNKEFAFMYGRISVVKNGGIIKIAQWFNTATDPWGRYAYNVMQKDASVTLSFNHDAIEVPYTVYAEVRADAQGSSAVHKANCSPVVGGSGWYFSYSDLLYYNNFYYKGSCPNPPASSGYTTQLAFDPAHVIYDQAVGYRFWRSPAIATIQ